MIEVGEYVRTEYGISKVIEKLDKYVTEEQICVDCVGGMYSQVISKQKVAKHSKQLIDLIEVKDIIEIELSEEFAEKKDKKKLIQIGDVYTKETLQRDIDNGIITKILTILSYNQYMANCYKVGGEDETN